MGPKTTDPGWNLLQKGADWLGLELTPVQVSQFAVYASELLVWNEKFNLTAITDLEQIQIRHFLDSLTCFLGFPGVGRSRRPLSRLPSLEGVALMDVGAGAGFPGLPLAIARPAMYLTLLESVRKKTDFLDHVIRVIGLKEVSVITGRAEDVARAHDHRERYDVVVSRAVAELAVLVEYCLPFVKVGGRLIAPKKADVKPEVDSAATAISILGGAEATVLPVEIPGLLDRRSLVLVDKVRPTPLQYPRRAGFPSKRPLAGSPS